MNTKISDLFWGIDYSKRRSNKCVECGSLIIRDKKHAEHYCFKCGLIQ